DRVPAGGSRIREPPPLVEILRERLDVRDEQRQVAARLRLALSFAFVLDEQRHVAARLRLARSVAVVLDEQRASADAETGARRVRGDRRKDALVDRALEADLPRVSEDATL